MLKYIIALVVLGGYSWLQWDRNYAYTNNFDPAVLLQPQAVETDGPQILENTPEYDIELTPKFRIETSGLVLMRRDNDSSLLQSASFKSVMPGYLMLAFGDALATKAYKNLVKRGNAVMSKDMRVANQLASETVVTASPEVFKKFRSLNTGDQVTLRGYAGDLKIFKAGERASGNSIATLGTSKSVIMVRGPEDIVILSRGSRIFFYLFAGCAAAAAVLLLTLLKP